MQWIACKIPVLETLVKNEFYMQALYQTFSPCLKWGPNTVYKGV